MIKIGSTERLKIILENEGMEKYCTFCHLLTLGLENCFYNTMCSYFIYDTWFKVNGVME